MKNKKHWLFGNNWRWLSLSLTLFVGCTEAQPDQFNITFDYQGSKSGEFSAFQTRPDTNGNIYGGAGDTTWSILGVHWSESRTLADFISFSLHSREKLIAGQVLKGDSLNSRITGKFGIKSAVPLNEVNDELSNPSVFTATKLIFNISEIYSDKYSSTLKGTFEGDFENTKGEVVHVSNGIVNWHPLP
jgi:hypothetical protein